jgi:hypothetical protein
MKLRAEERDERTRDEMVREEKRGKWEWKER